jgi:hypothetical protein
MSFGVPPTGLARREGLDEGKTEGRAKEGEGEAGPLEGETIDCAREEEEGDLGWAETEGGGRVGVLFMWWRRRRWRG